MTRFQTSDWIAALALTVAVRAACASGQTPNSADVLADPDVHAAYVNELWAWNDHGPCTRLVLCATYFDDFGANLKFSDGSVVPFAHVQRLTTSAHDCIQNAKHALNPKQRQGGLQPADRALAVEWVMASQIHNKPLMDWMKNHPDAVITALYFVH